MQDNLIVQEIFETAKLVNLNVYSLIHKYATYTAKM